MSPPSLARSERIERKTLLLQRIDRQRLVRRARRLQAAIDRLRSASAQTDAGFSSSAHSEGQGFPRSRLFSELNRNPWMVGGILALTLLSGPGRLGRLLSWVLPMLLRRS